MISRNFLREPVLLFCSPIFLFLFLPLVLAGYWLVGKKLRNIFLLGSSIFFYAWGDGRHLSLLLFLIIANYVLGLVVATYRGSSKGRLFIWLSLLVNFGSLVWYKYAAFFADNINSVLNYFGSNQVHVPAQHLPLGISFITFQAIAYILDIYHKESAPQKNITTFALFMALFPKLTAGPIIRYDEVAKDLPSREIELEEFSYGVKRFAIGLGKKVLIADTIAKTTDQIFAIPQQDLTTGVAWLGIVCYTLQLYFDFSGYSDMAIGLGRMFGFKIRENFNYPYFAKSLTDFWRRWHISLSTWFRDYLFTPLTYALMTDRFREKIAKGGYKTNYRVVFSIFVVFTLCGLWHGAGYGFIVWGMLHGAVLGIETLWLGNRIKNWRIPLQHAYLIVVVMMSWVLFRSPSLQSAFSYYKALLGFSAGTGLQYHLSLYLNTQLFLALLVGVFASTPIAENIAASLGAFKRVTPAAEIAFILFTLVASFGLLANSTLSAFIYQQF